MSTGGSYLDRLAARARTVGNCLCLGIDPDPSALPAGFADDAAGVERFARLLLEAAGPYAAAVKVNLAFFEAYGSAGIAALERFRAAIPTDLPLILDAKRADIGSTAARQSVALFDALGADAITASPYLGLDALEPFLARPDRHVYVLCRTSNPGAAAVQDLVVTAHDGAAAMPLFLHVAYLAAGWSTDGSSIGLVCGATAPAELALVRAAAPGLPFLVPGVGAQGGDLAPVLDHGPASTGAASAAPGGALLVNISRSIAGAATAATDPLGALRFAAEGWSERLRC